MLNKANKAQIRPHSRLFAIYFVMWRYCLAPAALGPNPGIHTPSPTGKKKGP